jgi:hypothetical protein
VAPPADLAAPHAGSPTSIEPPPPIAAAPTAPAAAASAPAPAATPTTAVTTLPVGNAGNSQILWIAIGGLVVVVAGLLIFLRGRK